jgi:hypothetical protein
MTLIIANGQTKTLVIFGTVSQEQFHKFMKKMEEGIGIIAKYVGVELNRAKARIQRGRHAVTNYVESLLKNLQHLGKEAA